MEDTETLKVGDIVKVSACYIDNMPHKMPAIMNVRVVGIKTLSDGSKELTFQHPADLK